MKKSLIIILLITIIGIIFILGRAKQNCINNVYSIKYWKNIYGEHQKNLLVFIKKIKKYLEKHKIRYWAYGGTLLGTLRHGGFIPWDDDIDYGFIRNKSNIDNLISDLKFNGIIIQDMFFGFKIINPSNPNEFIDMFEFYQKPDGFYPNEETLNLWPKEYFSFNELSNITNKKFEDIELPCPNSPELYCFRTYGSDCFTKFRLQKPHFEKNKLWLRTGNYLCGDEDFYIKFLTE